MISGIVRMIYSLRRVWNSSLPFAVCHCGELSEANNNLLTNLDQSVHIVNLCDRDPVFQNMTVAQARYKLRGFFCKVAALIKSPFEDTMVVDADVVWLKSPEGLFEAPQYKRTGSLFFRDRTLTGRSDKEIHEFSKLFEDNGLDVNNQTVAKQMAHENGGSFFWRHHVDEWRSHVFPKVTEYQDSSVVLLNKMKHAATIEVLERLLCDNFDVGYGDKEIFWSAATIAKQPFSFEPYLAGQYGDCFGLILHFDPADAERDPPLSSSATPLYINAEYMVEDELVLFGQFLQHIMSSPILIPTAPFSKHGSSESPLWHNVTDFNDIWTRGGKEVPSTGCVCKHNPCETLHPSINTQLAISQWLTLSLRLSGDKSRSECIPIVLSYAPLVEAVFDSFALRNDCLFIGCPDLPYSIDATLADWNTSWPQYCDPITFTEAHEHNLRDAALEARTPWSQWNRRPHGNNVLVQCGTASTIYIVRNYSVLVAIPSKEAFLTLGRDFSEVKRIAANDCGRLYSASTNFWS